MKIMVIEDDFDVREAIELSLHQYGHEVVAVSDRDMALSEIIASKSHPDIILMDLCMPGMTASRFMEQISTCCPKTCVVLMTATYRAQSAANELNIPRTLCKPFGFEELLCTVNEIVSEGSK